MFNFPDLFHGSMGLLNNPGDIFSAKITKSGKQVVKLHKKEYKRTAVRYPGTGTIVETIVRREEK